MLAVRTKPPTFAVVSQLAFELKGIEVIDKTLLVFPGELKNFIAKNSDALSKFAGVELLLKGGFTLLNRLPSCHIDFGNHGATILVGVAGRFKEFAVPEGQALRVISGVVGEFGAQFQRPSFGFDIG